MSDAKPKLTPEEQTMADDLQRLADADAKAEKDTKAKAEADAKASEKAATAETAAKEKELKVAKKKIGDGTHVLHEDGHLVEVSPEYYTDAEKGDPTWRKWRQVRAKDGPMLHHVGESDGEWTYREEP